MVDFSSDHDFAADSKIGFYARSGIVDVDDPTQLTDFQKKRIDQALAQALTYKGLEVVERAEEADLLISWHLNTVEKQNIRTYNTTRPRVMVGFSNYNRYATYTCFACATEQDVRVTEYTQGTFIVDMIDPEQQQSVWRSVTQSKIKGDALRDQAAIDAAAAVILEAFPPDR